MDTSHKVIGCAKMIRVVPTFEIRAPYVYSVKATFCPTSDRSGVKKVVGQTRKLKLLPRVGDTI